MRRLFSTLVFAVLAFPASLLLPGRQGVAAGESCAITCGHAAGQACCCGSEHGNGASFKRCAPERDGYTPAASQRFVVSAAAQRLIAPAASESLDLADSSLAACVPRGLPEPVPRLLS